MLQLVDQAVGLRRGRGSGAKVYRLRRPAPESTRTVAVTSGKGGVGKTQLSANLGIAMARQGHRVILFDADLGLASLDLALGLSPRWDLRSVLRGDRKIQDIVVPGPGGVFLLPACPGRYEMANLGQSERSRLIAAVREVARDFDVLIIDTGAGINSNAVGFASVADDVLLVTTPDPTSLRDAYAMAKVLNRRSGLERILLVGNQAQAAEGARIHSELKRIAARFLELDLCYLGCVPPDPAIVDGVRAGQPVTLRTPDSLGARAISAIARRLDSGPAPREAS